MVCWMPRNAPWQPFTNRSKGALAKPLVNAVEGLLRALVGKRAEVVGMRRFPLPARALPRERGEG